MIPRCNEMARENGRPGDMTDKLTQALRGIRRLIIVGHDNPDPDVLASSLALKHLARTLAGVNSVITCGGVLGRAENKAMVRLLRIHLTPMGEIRFGNKTTGVAVLDTQPGTGNNSLPAGVKPLIVIDHHPRRKATAAPFVDIRSDYGSTSTILTEYLLGHDLEIPASLATALSYGIASETIDLSRETGEADIRAYLTTLTRASKRQLAQINHPKVSRYYFTTLSRAMKSAFSYRNVIGTRLGEVAQPDVVAQVADLLLSHERMSWAICTGFYREQLLLSVRSSNARAKLGALTRRIVGNRGTAGGHELSAGAQIPCHSLVPAERLRLEECFILEFVRSITHSKEIEVKPLVPQI
jgi:nanoRNase/pAp phosphatase (c-di-AMP/oligoRNAs hydrolase)